MYKKITSAAIILAFAFSCDFYDLDINVDPNDPSTASVDLLLPSIQFDWAGDYQTIHNTSAGIMGHTSNSDQLNFTQNSFDGLWQAIYLDEVADLDEYIKSASAVDENDNLLRPGDLAIGQIMQAQIFSTMVDLFGDVPFSEAAKGNDDGNVNPAFDDQADIYAECLRLVDEAITNLGLADPQVGGADLIYGGDGDSWLKAAYSLKLKLLMQVRRASGFSYGSGVDAEITSLVADPSIFIRSSSDDMAFRWNTSVELGQRHPWMGNVYGGDNAFSYITHQLMYEMLINGDPRIAYYFKRQTSTVLDQDDPTQANTTPCSQNSACIYGYMVLNSNVMTELAAAGVSTTPSYVASFFGRDKGDPSGIPLDGALRTAPGVFPMGGQFDAGSPSKINSSDGLGLGDGYTYFISAPMVSLYLLEAYLEVTGATADASTEFSNFLQLSFDMVEDASQSISGAGAPAMTVANITAATQHGHVIEVADYITNAETRYTAAADKMAVVYKEAWYSLWGQAFELYNAHRRTDYPRMKTSQSGTRGIADIQYPTYRATSTSAGQRDFPVRWTYPVTEFSLNTNLTDILLSDGDTGIFWDPALFKYN